LEILQKRVRVDWDESVPIYYPQYFKRFTFPGLPRLPSHWSNNTSSMVQVLTTANNSQAQRVAAVILLLSYLYLCRRWRYVYGSRYHRLYILHYHRHRPEAPPRQIVMTLTSGDLYIVDS
ncbi:hypothetical protein OESDEN_12923, partial [Oesophagostomum dentatum]